MNLVKTELRVKADATLEKAIAAEIENEKEPTKEEFEKLVSGYLKEPMVKVK